jgi:hypothetical protein
MIQHKVYVHNHNQVQIYGKVLIYHAFFHPIKNQVLIKDLFLNMNELLVKQMHEFQYEGIYELIYVLFFLNLGT